MRVTLAACSLVIPALAVSQESTRKHRRPALRHVSPPVTDPEPIWKSRRVSRKHRTLVSKQDYPDVGILASRQLLDIQTSLQHRDMPFQPIECDYERYFGFPCFCDDWQNLTGHFSCFESGGELAIDFPCHKHYCSFEVYKVSNQNGTVRIDSCVEFPYRERTFCSVYYMSSDAFVKSGGDLSVMERCELLVDGEPCSSCSVLQD